MNLDEIISKILNTAPYQLPPVVHTAGTYQVDCRYRGHAANIVTPRLEQTLERYLDWVVTVNDQHRFRSNDFDKLPIPYGSTVNTKYENQTKPTTI